jgi:hypothetical protein
VVSKKIFIIASWKPPNQCQANFKTLPELDQRRIHKLDGNEKKRKGGAKTFSFWVFYPGPNVIIRNLLIFIIS